MKYNLQYETDYPGHRMLAISGPDNIKFKNILSQKYKRQYVNIFPGHNNPFKTQFDTKQ